MSSASHNLNSCMPQMSSQMACSLVVGGGAFVYYGYSKWRNADQFSDRVKATVCMVIGSVFAAMGAMGAMGTVCNTLQPSFTERVSTVYPNPRLHPVETCHTLFQAGISPGEMRIHSAERRELDSFMPPMQEGVHYSGVKGVDIGGHLHCWASLTDLAKKIIGKGTLRVHSAGVPGVPYVKANLH